MPQAHNSKPQLSKLFKNQHLLEQALTHKSWVNEHPGNRMSNERLEFLGDAILEYVVSKEIYVTLPDKEEGYLTALRANLVNTTSLAKVAVQLELGKQLFLSKGEEETGGRNNPSMMADTVEALIGALFIDRGIKAAENFIKDNILVNLEAALNEPLKDAKSTLQEVVQEKGLPAPQYEVVNEEGPDHAKVFTIEARISGKGWGQGTGKNKSEAAQAAAKAALANFTKTANGV